MKQILIDSGPMIALFDGSDNYHKPSVEFIKNNSHQLVSTISSVTEVMYLLDFSKNAQLDFINWIASGAIIIEKISHNDFFAIRAMLVKYRNLPMDFADACLVFLANKLKINTIATIDRDFDIYRLNNNKTLTVLIK